MKIRFLAILLLVLGAHAGFTQQSPDLTVTSLTGKVLTFQTPEQKAQFLAARDKSRQTPAPTPSPTPQTGGAPAAADHVTLNFGKTALDEKPAMSGKVNVGAPTFTADYYGLAPETWIGKKLTLSVAYLRDSGESTRGDGMRVLQAYTWGTTQGNGQQNSGGSMVILATPAAAQRLLTLCGTVLRYHYFGYKVTLIHGELQDVQGAYAGGRRYGLIVTQ